MRFLFSLLLGVVFTYCSANAMAGVKDKRTASEASVFIHNAPEILTDTRYRYHWLVLEAALEATKKEFGPYTLKVSNQYMNESRQVVEIQKSGQVINMMVLDTTAEMEAALLPVKIPIDRGLLGYRVFLIHKKDQEKFEQVKSLDDLKKFVMGQGFDWSDLRIFKSAGFPVMSGSSYEGLFQMLMAGRFDAFGRGVTEVLPELEQRQKKFPNMVIEKSVLLYYPLPVYFWFARSPEGELRAKRIENGLWKIIRNGTLEKLFQSEFSGAISTLSIKNRRFFKIDNPTLPPDQPFSNKQLWFEPFH